MNTAANEECEAGSLCNVKDCRYAFTLGGGCAGCAANGQRDPLWIVGLFGFAFCQAARRRARRVSST